MPAQGIALPLAVFDAIAHDERFAAGRDALSATRGGAIERARHMLDVIAHAKLTSPDTFVLARLVPSHDALAFIAPEERGRAAGSDLVEHWHAVPLYPVYFPDGRMMKAVVDPFLKKAPLSLLDWQIQLSVKNVDLIARDEIEKVKEAASTEPGHNIDATTKRAGTGTADDAHGLAKLLREWLKDPLDVSHVTRMRALFGEVTWKSFEETYPTLMKKVEASLKRS